MANHYWHHVIKYSHVMGHVDRSNLYNDPIILREVTGTQASRDLMQARHLSLIPMVAPRTASVTFSLSPNTLEDLDKALAIIV